MHSSFAPLPATTTVIPILPDDLQGIALNVLDYSVAFLDGECTPAVPFVLFTVA